MKATRNDETGNDGLTDAEREEYARRYRTTGAGRPTGQRERDAIADRLANYRHSDHVQRVVAQAPALSSEQRHRIAGLLAPAVKPDEPKR